MDTRFPARRRRLDSSLTSGPKTASELLRETRLPKKTLYRELDRMVKLGMLTVFPFLQDGRWQSLYALPVHSNLASRMSGFQRRPEAAGVAQAPRNQRIIALQRQMFRQPQVAAFPAPA